MMIRLHNGDCIEYMRTMNKKSIDLIVTDPPYLLQMSGGGQDRISKSKQAQGKDLKKIADGFPPEFMEMCCEIMKKINIYVFCSKEQLPILYDFFVTEKKCYWELITWCKENAIPACNNVYRPDVEYCFFAREKGVPLFGDCKTKSHFYVSFTNTTDKKKYGHPTPKPLELVERLVLNSSQEKDTVFDPFMGSGTTGVASVINGRNFIGCEIENNYFGTAKERIKTAECSVGEELILI